MPRPVATVRAAPPDIREGVSLDPKKISAIKDIDPTSINSLEAVRFFLGMVGYYRNHIENVHILSS